MRTGNKKGIRPADGRLRLRLSVGARLHPPDGGAREHAERRAQARQRADRRLRRLAGRIGQRHGGGGAVRAARIGVETGRRGFRQHPRRPGFGLFAGERRGERPGIGGDRRRGPGRPRRGRPGRYAWTPPSAFRTSPSAGTPPTRTTAANILPPERSRPIWPSPASLTAGRWSSGSTAPSTRRRTPGSGSCASL